MYNITRNTYSCDFCGAEMQFNEHDDWHGDLWGCDCCETIWCTKCFVDRHGRAAFNRMLQENNRIYCPVCYENHKEDFI